MNKSIQIDARERDAPHMKAAAGMGAEPVTDPRRFKNIVYAARFSDPRVEWDCTSGESANKRQNNKTIKQ